jgi:hypothetical protein
MVMNHRASTLEVAELDVANHYRHSSLRERIVEHIFVGDALRELWRDGITDVEVLRSEFDAHGYDLVMSRGQIVRHIQFKTSTRNKPIKVSISRHLFEKPSGCVIWIKISSDLSLKPFYWLGAEPGQPLSAIDGLRAAKGRRNKDGKRIERPNHVYVPDAQFERVPTLRGVLRKLFETPGEGASAARKRRGVRPA